MPANSETRKGSSGFFSKPWVGMAGLIIGAAGIALAVFFFLANKDERKLNFFVHPVKTILASSNLEIDLPWHELYKSDDKLITKANDVTAVQIAFWNSGDLSIKKADVLKRLTIQTKGEIPIWQAFFKKQSRIVTGVELLKENMSKGRLDVKWEILEKNDGAVVQLIILGGVETTLEAKAIIEGQPEINYVEFSKRIKTPTEQYNDYIKNKKEALWIIIIGPTSIIAMLLAVVLLRVKTLRKGFDFDRKILEIMFKNVESRKPRARKIPIIIAFVYFIGLALFIAIVAFISYRAAVVAAGPPFGF